jgi:SMI1 / KNR4 family (SUKH-1)
MAARRFGPGTPLTLHDLAEIETALGRVLHPAYRAFAREYGDAFVGGLVDGSEDLPILQFLGARRILSSIAMLRDLTEIGAFSFADCELGNPYVMDVDGSIFYIDYYGGTTRAHRVSDSFEDFLDRIVVEDP